MLRRSVLNRSSSIRPSRVLLLRGRKSLHRRLWSPLLGTVVLAALSLVWASRNIAAAEPSLGFTQSCAGITQDPLLGALLADPPKPGADKYAPALATMVPRLSLRGTALATYEPRRGGSNPTTLEAVFGILPGAQRAITEASFAQDGRAVMMYPNVLATVAHALTPEIVEVQVAQQASVHTVPLRVTDMAVELRPSPTEEAGVSAHVAHINVPYDLALAQVGANRLLQPLPYQAVLSYGTGDPEKPLGGLQAGDCVATVITVRGDKSSDTGRDRLVLGKVLAKVPVATNSLTQTKLNVNMFTTDLPVQPGDSGSPVLALRDGKPVLVGLVSATMFPTATFTYVTRIDPLLAMAEALRLATLPEAKPLLVRRTEPASPPQ